MPHSHDHPPKHDDDLGKSRLVGHDHCGHAHPPVQGEDENLQAQKRHHSDGHHHQGDHHHHDHGPGGHHHGAVANLKIAFFLNLGFTILEVFGGIYTNSIAILSDALHDLGDSLSLGLAWYLEHLSKKAGDRSYSYGYARFSVLGAFVNSVVLIVGAIFILQNAIPRIVHPQTSDAKGMILFAAIGIGVNGLAALRLSKGGSLNERVVALHLLEDVLGWVAILIGSIVMLFADIPVLDPILSIAIMIFVLVNVFRNLRKSLRIFLQGTPAHLPVERVQERLRALEGVLDVHDLHLWTLDGQLNVATLHVVVAGPMTLPELELIKSRVRAALKEMQITHATIEIEDQDVHCELGDCAENSTSNSTVLPHAHA